MYEDADMPKMQEKNTRRIPILSQMLVQYRALGAWWRAKFHKGKHSKMEVEYGRHDTRASIDRFVKRFWDANNVGKRVEKILRPASREEEATRLQEKAERTRKRSLRLSQLSKNEGWRDLEKLLEQYEIIAYTNLRFPSTRKDNVSLDEWIGVQNGTLGVIEGIRQEVRSAVTSLKPNEQ